jgi:hypothetical protein
VSEVYLEIDVPGYISRNRYRPDIYKGCMRCLCGKKCMRCVVDIQPRLGEQKAHDIAQLNISSNVRWRIPFIEKNGGHHYCVTPTGQDHIATRDQTVQPSARGSSMRTIPNKGPQASPQLPAAKFLSQPHRNRLSDSTVAPL